MAAAADSTHLDPRPLGAAWAARPLVSVIVRSMDRPTLAAALDSVAVQRYAPIEVLVVNAAGAPHRALPGHCGGFELRLIDEGGGALARPQAANVGLRHARGQGLMFLDDDDLLLPDHLYKLVAAAVAAPAAAAVYADVDLGRMGAQGWVTEHSFAADFDRQRLWFENYLPIHAVLFKAALTEPLGTCRFDERLPVFEDWDFWLQLAEHGDFVRVPGVSARYVAADDSNSGVFAATPASAEARALLFAKWHHRHGAPAWADFLDHAQRHYRLAHEVVATRALLRARESEVAAGIAHAANLQQVLAARDLGLMAAAAHATGLGNIVAARDAEIQAFKTQAAATSTELTALQSALTHLNAQGPLAAFARALKRRLHGSK